MENITFEMIEKCFDELPTDNSIRECRFPVESQDVSFGFIEENRDETFLLFRRSITAGYWQFCYKESRISLRILRKILVLFKSGDIKDKLFLPQNRITISLFNAVGVHLDLLKYNDDILIDSIYSRKNENEEWEFGDNWEFRKSF